ncbi:T9SS type A sorting domain-containing protein [Candidatus Fermentibacteria bacterium]|nr:T9SS type A sorting domain-containing protein [Candidatus Fermentibacteria bacterium]
MRLTVLSVIVSLMLAGTASATLHQDAKAPAPGRTSVAMPRDGLAQDPNGPPSPAMPPAQESQRSPADFPDAGFNWVLGQGIMYPSTATGSKMLGPLCYYNTRKVVGGDDEVFVAGWEAGSDADNEIMITSWDSFFGLWSPPAPISESPTDAGRVDLARGADGTIHAAWHQNYSASTSVYEIFYAQLPAGGFQWSAPVRVSLADATESNFPNVGVDNAGNVTVRWAELLRDASGGIAEYRGYAVNTSTDNGVTWSDDNVRVAAQGGERIYGAMCVDPISGDIYLVDFDPDVDPADEYDDLIVYHYNKATDTWEGPEIIVYAGGPDEPLLHAVMYPSAAVGPDGTVHVLYAQTTNTDPGYIWVDTQVGMPVAAQLYMISGTYGNWGAPEAIYPGTDGIYEGYEGVYPDSTWLQFCSFAQVGLDANNRIYVATRAYEYYNGGYLTGFSDMNSDLAGGNWQPEEWIAAKDLNRNGEWVWTRGSDINLRPDSIGVKYSKVPERMPTGGACAVWDETYTGYMPEKVMFVRLTDFTAPGPLTDIVPTRPVENGPVTFTWTNPADEDLAGVQVIRLTTGKGHLVGLRRGLIPLNDAGEWLYDQENDVFVLEPEEGEPMPTEWTDETAPAGTVYYTFVPYDVNLHHLYPIPDHACVRVDSIVVGSGPAQRPSSLQLDGLSPNPAISGTDIRFAVAEAGQVRIAMYDVSGRCVATLMDGRVDAGLDTVRWDLTATDGSRVGNGVYVCRLEQGSRSTSRHVVVVR